MKITWFLFFMFFYIAVGHEIESNFYYEESCGTAQPNGYCVLENECPHTVNAKYKQLCPSQKHLGAVCCKHFPIEKLNCAQSHNDCRDSSSCPKHLQLGKKGCPSNQICCVLV